MPDFRTLEAFYWVAQLSSFRRASERLHLTQSAISQRVAALETRLGVKLFDRNGRAAALTPKGRLVLEQTERILRLRSEMLTSARAPEAVSGILRLGVAETIVHTWLSAFVKRAHSLYPALKIDIEVDVTTQLRRGLVEQELDLAFLLGPLNDPSMLNLKLCRYELAFIRAPGFDLGPEPVTLEALVQVPIITYPRTTAPYAQLQRLLQRSDLAPPRVFGNTSLSTIIRMTLDRIGISVIPPIVIRDEISNRHLELLQTEIELPDLDFNATYAGSADNIIAPTLAELAVTIAQDFDKNI